MVRPVRSTLFDFNGVLVDDEHIHFGAFAEVLARRGIALSERDYAERYLGFDDAVHAAAVPGASFVSDLSLWDTHRSQSVWHALAAPRALADTAASLLEMTAQGDMGMPRWPFANLYTGITRT
jgi:beta-phosphoglucomutase-like phosphatase (HAD superfamily)